MQQPNGLVLWRGRGFDRKPVVAIVTGLQNRSANGKTGAMLQVWILPTEVNPVQSVQTGADQSVCGTCPLRGGGACYVNVGQAPLAIWRALQRGRYPDWDGSVEPFRGRKIRWGAYGDPALLPIKLVRRINKVTAGWTAYTHATATRPLAREFAMASADTVAEWQQLRAEGWKTFRTRLDDEPLQEGEFECPASKEQGYRLTCSECMACRGGDWTGQATPSIVVHGAKASRFLKSLV